MIKYLFTILLFCFYCISSAQKLAAIQANNRFVVFDECKQNTLSLQPITNLQVGYTYVSYVNDAGQLQIYADGNTARLRGGLPTKTIYEQQGMYLNYGLDWIFHSGDNYYEVGKWIYDIKVSNQNVAYVDRNDELHHNYAGKDTIIEDWEVESYKVSDSLLAFVDQNGQFKVYNKEELFVIDEITPLAYKMKQKTLVYVDAYSVLKVIWSDGFVEELASFATERFFVGNDIVFFQDENENFVYATPDTTAILLDEWPETFQISRNYAYYADMSGQYFVISSGKPQLVTTLEPQFIKINDEMIAWVDWRDNLFAFQGNTWNKITNRRLDTYTRKAKAFDLKGLNLIYWLGQNDYEVKCFE